MRTCISEDCKSIIKNFQFRLLLLVTRKNRQWPKDVFQFSSGNCYCPGRKFLWRCEKRCLKINFLYRSSLRRLSWNNSRTWMYLLNRSPLSSRRHWTWRWVFGHCFANRYVIWCINKNKCANVILRTRRITFSQPYFAQRWQAEQNKRINKKTRARKCLPEILFAQKVEYWK